MRDVVHHRRREGLLDVVVPPTSWYAVLGLTPTSGVAVNRHLQLQLGLAVLRNRQQRVAAHERLQWIEHNVLLYLLLTNNEFAPAGLTFLWDVLGFFVLHVQGNGEDGFSIDLHFVNEFRRGSLFLWSDLLNDLAVLWCFCSNLHLDGLSLNHWVI